MLKLSVVYSGHFVKILNQSTWVVGANGRTGREWRKLVPYLKSRLGKECNVSPFYYVFVYFGFHDTCVFTLFDF